MGIYIPGMEMPKNCDALLHIHKDGKAVLYPFDGENQPTEYQALSVPKHGRLIDADALIHDIRCEILEHQMNGLKGTPLYLDDLRMMWQRLEDEDIAPTIIPAEEGEA